MDNLHLCMGDEISLIPGRDFFHGTKREHPFKRQTPCRIISGKHGVVGRQSRIAVYINGSITASFPDGGQPMITRTPKSYNCKTFHDCVSAPFHIVVF